VADDEGTAGASVIQHSDQVGDVHGDAVRLRQVRAAAPASQVGREEAYGRRLAAKLTCDGAIRHVARRHPVQDEHDVLTGLGRRPGACNGQCAAGYWNVEVRLEWLALEESLWEVAAALACFRL
jgi:hypothetical protein